MPNNVVASVQYNDFRGTAAVDGFKDHFLAELAEKADLQGYVPIGFSFYSGEPRMGEWFPQVKIFAVDPHVVGKTIAEVAEYAKICNTIPVFRFDVDITFDDLLKLVKRLHVVVARKDVADVPMRMVTDDVTY